MLALQPEITVSEAADTLVATAGATPAAPIAVRRALTRLQSANDHRPSHRTAEAVEALRLALARLPARHRGSSEMRPDRVPPSEPSTRRYEAR